MERFDRSIRPLAWTAGMDWFRFRVDDLGRTREARDRADEIISADARRGSNVKRWTFQGYRGLASESIRYGERGGRLIWETSGERAASTADRMGLSGGLALRIDLQVTLRLSTSLPTFGTYLLPFSARTQTTSLRSRTPVGLSLGTSGLWLGTVGRRTSRSYFRLYDKGVESKLAPRGVLWRLELEAKHEHAAELCRVHYDSLKIPQFSANYTISSWTSSGCFWPYKELVTYPVDSALGVKQETTAGKLAIWITHTVRPVIPRLLSVFTVAEVLTMLGLSDVAAPIGRDNAHPE